MPHPTGAHSPNYENVNQGITLDKKEFPVHDKEKDVGLTSGRRARRVCLYIEDDADVPMLTIAAQPKPSPPRKGANPGPIGLLGFGMTTVLLNLHNTDKYPLATAIPAMGICFGGGAQLIAGILEFTRGNTFAFVAFTSYGSFWLSLVCIWYLENNASNPLLHVHATDSYFLGIYLLIWGIYTFMMFICSLKTNVALMTIFGTLTLLFFLLAAGRMGNQPTTLKVAGYEGILCGSSALYLAFAEVVNEVYGRVLLPVGSMERFWAKKERAQSEDERELNVSV